MENKQNIMCETCILLVKCIQRYKECQKNTKKYAFVRMSRSCSLIWNMCDYDNIYNMYKKWWDDNHGK